MDGDLDELATALAQEHQAEQLAALAGERHETKGGRPAPAPWLQTLRLELREFVADDFDDLCAARTATRA